MKNIYRYKNSDKSENRHRKGAVLLCVAAFVFFGFILQPVNRIINAATINVPADLITIQAAVDSAIAGDTVKVAAGFYNESVVMKAGVDIEGAGAVFTTITTNTESFTVTGADDSIISGFLITNIVSRGSGILCDDTSPTITNCRISDCGFGILCKNGGSPIIKGNIIDNNSDNGINLTNTTGSVTILNNVIFGHNDSGIKTINSSASTIKNNIIYNNNDTAIDIDDETHEIINNTIHKNWDGLLISGATTSITNNIIASNSNWGILNSSGSHALSFNDVFGNGTDYQNIDPGFADISEDPLFVDVSNADFHLKSDSPAIDAGSTVILDLDGSRSDMGAFGGPGATETSSVGGPVVSDVVVSPNPVEQGETITIRASASAQ